MDCEIDELSSNEFAETGLPEVAIDPNAFRRLQATTDPNPMHRQNHYKKKLVSAYLAADVPIVHRANEKSFEEQIKSAAVVGLTPEILTDIQTEGNELCGLDRRRVKTSANLLIVLGVGKFILDTPPEELKLYLASHHMGGQEQFVLRRRSKLQGRKAQSKKKPLSFADLEKQKQSQQITGHT